MDKGLGSEKQNDVLADDLDKDNLGMCTAQA